MEKLIELNPDKFERKEWVALAYARDWAVFRGYSPDDDLVKEYEALYTDQERRDLLAVLTIMDFANRTMNTITKKTLVLEENGTP